MPLLVIRSDSRDGVRMVPGVRLADHADFPLQIPPPSPLPASDTGTNGFPPAARLRANLEKHRGE